MKNFKYLSILALLAVALVIVPAPADAQAVTTQTTLVGSVSAAVNSTLVQQLCVASATGILVPSLSGNTSGSLFMVDKEAFQVTGAGSSTTCFRVKRGQLGTTSASHANSAVVWVGTAATGTGDTSRPFSNGAFVSVPPTGTCVASAQFTLPIIITGAPQDAYQYAGQQYSCIAGFWTPIPGIATAGSGIGSPYTVFTTLANPGNLIAPTSVTHVAGKMFFSSIYIPVGGTLTGACWLNGATVTTDNTIAFLADASGAIIANAALAGVADSTGGASKYQCAAFTATVNVAGPAVYYVGIQTAGTTDNFQAYATGGAPTNYGTGSQTGVFGTLTAITPNATFTTAVGPLMMVF